MCFSDFLTLVGHRWRWFVAVGRKKQESFPTAVSVAVDLKTLFYYKLKKTLNVFNNESKTNAKIFCLSLNPFLSLCLPRSPSA